MSTSANTEHKHTVPVCVTCDPADTSTSTSTVPSTVTHFDAVVPPTATPTGHAKDVAIGEDVLDPSTFVPPVVAALTPGVIIEFCDRCRWLHRATWTQTELYLTFPPPTIGSISLIGHNSPNTPGGRFRVWLSYIPPPSSAESESTPNDPIGEVVGSEAVADVVKTELIWDRKVRGGFPEMKELKQLIRDRIQPGTSLGHSDKKGKAGAATGGE